MNNYFSFRKTEENPLESRASIKRPTTAMNNEKIQIKRGESEAPTFSTRNQARLLENKKFHKKDAPSVPPVNKKPSDADKIKENSEEEKKSFLKRKTKKVDPVKLDWKKVGRRIDCWLPKKEKVQNSGGVALLKDQKKQNMQVKIVHPAQSQQSQLQQAQKSDKKSTPSKIKNTNSSSKKNKNMQNEDRIEAGTKAVIMSPEENKIVVTTKKIASKLITPPAKKEKSHESPKSTKKARKTTEELCKIYNTYHAYTKDIESEYSDRIEKNESCIPVLLNNSEFFGLCNTNYEVFLILGRKK